MDLVRGSYRNHVEKPWRRIGADAGPQGRYSVVGLERFAPSEMRFSESSKIACACAFGSSLDSSSRGLPSARDATVSSSGILPSSSMTSSIDPWSSLIESVSLKVRCRREWYPPLPISSAQSRRCETPAYDLGRRGIIDRCSAIIGLNPLTMTPQSHCLPKLRFTSTCWRVGCRPYWANNSLAPICMDLRCSEASIRRGVTSMSSWWSVGL